MIATQHLACRVPANQLTNKVAAATDCVGAAATRYVLKGELAGDRKILLLVGTVPVKPFQPAAGGYDRWGVWFERATSRGLTKRSPGPQGVKGSQRGAVEPRKVNAESIASRGRSVPKATARLRPTDRARAGLALHNDSRASRPMPFAQALTNRQGGSKKRG